MKNEDKPDILIWTGENQPTRRLTCIISNDLDNFAHLVNLETVDVCKKIVNYSDSVFDDVDILNLPAIIDASLNAGFSKFYQFNPHLRRARGKEPVSNEGFASKEHYNQRNTKLVIKEWIKRNATTMEL